MIKFKYVLIPYLLYYGPEKIKSYFETYFSNLQNMADNSDLLDALFSNNPELLKKYIKQKNEEQDLNKLLKIQNKLKYYLSLRSRL
jgi:hypothetical protein